MNKINIAVTRLMACACMLLFPVVHTTAQPKREVRAAWITCAYGLDWPKVRATSAESMKRQQDELIMILDRLKEANFNTVLFQARTRGNVLYHSEIESMDAVLTGKIGGNPGYDPLAFAIDECHKRGMECHAWMVAIPLGNRRHVEALGKKSIKAQKPELCVTFQRHYYLNPGHPETKEYLMSLIKEVVENYDIDGIHLDYLRYPDGARRFPDGYEYRSYAKGRDLSQWRRDNLTEIVRYIYKSVKDLKPWVKVSTCPVGKYRDTNRYTTRGWNAYNAVYQDVQGWLGEGIQDQIYPMMYFRGNNFYPFAIDWQEQSNGRHVIPGLGIYFLHPSEGDWTLDEIERQLHFIRRQELEGEAYFRAEFLMENTGNIYSLLYGHFYTAPALQPSMPWIDDQPPTVPTGLTVKRLPEGECSLAWQKSTDNDNRNEPLYTIYASDVQPVDTENPANIIATGIRGTSYTYIPIYPWEERMYFAVTAIDRCGNESAPCQSE